MLVQAFQLSLCVNHALLPIANYCESKAWNTTEHM